MSGGFPIASRRCRAQDLALLKRVIKREQTARGDEYVYRLR